MIFSSPDKNKIGTGEDVLSRNKGNLDSEEYLEEKRKSEESGN